MTRTYVVTGSASGIGAATSKMLKEAGHTVIGVDIHDADVNADLSTPLGRHAGAAAAIKYSNNSIDAVIACAGLAHPIAKTVSVNYFGVTEFLYALLPTLYALLPTLCYATFVLFILVVFLFRLSLVVNNCLPV